LVPKIINAKFGGTEKYLSKFVGSENYLLPIWIPQGVIFPKVNAWRKMQTRQKVAKC